MPRLGPIELLEGWAAMNMVENSGSQEVIFMNVGKRQLEAVCREVLAEFNSSKPVGFMVTLCRWA